MRAVLATGLLGLVTIAAGCGRNQNNHVGNVHGGSSHTIEARKANNIEGVGSRNQALGEKEFEIVRILQFRAHLMSSVLKTDDIGQNRGIRSLLKTDQEKKESLQLAQEIDQKRNLYFGQNASQVFSDFNSEEEQLKVVINRAKNNENKTEVLYEMMTALGKGVCFAEDAYNKAVQRKDGSEKNIHWAFFDTDYAYRFKMDDLEELGRELLKAKDYKCSWLPNDERLPRFVNEFERFNKNSPLNQRASFALVAGR